VIIEWLERVTHRKFTNLFTNREFNTSISLDTPKIHQSPAACLWTLQLVNNLGDIHFKDILCAKALEFRDENIDLALAHHSFHRIVI
jgi:hypothetical protein